MRRLLSNPGAGHVVAVVSTAAAVLVRWLLDPWVGNSFPLATLFGAVAVSVWFGGIRPALLTTVVGYLACAYLFIEPRGSFGFSASGPFVGLSMYLVSCVFLIGAGEAMQRWGDRTARRWARRHGLTGF